MIKALVTGGAGFIGSHLVDYLLEHDYEVSAIDDLSTGARDNLAAVANHRHFRFVEGSVSDEAVMEPLVKEAQVIYHLAAAVGVKRIVDQLVASIENNVQGTETVLRLAAKRQCKVLLTSTSEVYGRSNDKPFAEDDDLRMGPTLKTRWSYACAKALDEYLAFAYWRELGLPVTVARLFNTVGERQTDAYGMVLPTFVKQALKDEPLTIYGDGQQSRCFCHVSDVVQALVKIMEHPATTGEVYNIGSDHEVSINQLADQVIVGLGSRSSKTYIPYEKAYKVGFDDIVRRVPDLSKIKALLGFKPTSALDDIIKRLAISLTAGEKQATVAVPLSLKRINRDV